MLRSDVEAEFLGRIIEVGHKRNVGDGRFVAEHEGRRRKPFVDDREIAVDEAFEKSQHRRIPGRPREILQETIGAEKAIDLLVVEDDPAQSLKPGVLVSRFETAGWPGQIGSRSRPNG